MAVSVQHHHRTIEEAITSLLKRLYDQYGHTCFPMEDVVRNVLQSTCGERECTLTYKNICSTIFRMRAAGVLALSTKPVPLVALRSILDIDKFVYDALHLLYGVRWSSLRSVWASISAYEDASGRTIHDLVKFATLSAFYDPGSLLIVDKHGHADQCFPGLVSYCCERSGVPCVVLGSMQRTLDGVCTTTYVTYSELEAVAVPRRNDTFMLVLMDADCMTSLDLKNVLVHLSGTPKIVFVGESEGSADGGAGMGKGSVFSDVLDAPCAKTIRICGVGEHTDASGAQVMRGVQQFCSDVTAGRCVEWVKEAYLTTATGDLAYCEVADDDACLAAPSALAKELQLEAADAAVLVLADDDAAKEVAVRSGQFALARSNAECTRFLDAWKTGKGPEALILVLTQSYPCALDATVAHAISNLGISRLVLVATPASFAQLTQGSSEGGFAACGGFKYSCLRKLMRTSNFDGM